MSALPTSDIITETADVDRKEGTAIVLNDGNSTLIEEGIMAYSTAERGGEGETSGPAALGLISLTQLAENERRAIEERTTRPEAVLTFSECEGGSFVLRPDGHMDVFASSPKAQAVLNHPYFLEAIRLCFNMDVTEAMAALEASRIIADRRSRGELTLDQAVVAVQDASQIARNAAFGTPVNFTRPLPTPARPSPSTNTTRVWHNAATSGKSSRAGKKSQPTDNKRNILRQEVSEMLRRIGLTEKPLWWEDVAGLKMRWGDKKTWNDRSRLNAVKNHIQANFTEQLVQLVIATKVEEVGLMSS